MAAVGPSSCYPFLFGKGLSLDTPIPEAGVGFKPSAPGFLSPTTASGSGLIASPGLNLSARILDVLWPSVVGNLSISPGWKQPWANGDKATGLHWQSTSRCPVGRWGWERGETPCFPCASEPSKATGSQRGARCSWRHGSTAAFLQMVFLSQGFSRNSLCTPSSQLCK